MPPLTGCGHAWFALRGVTQYVTNTTDRLREMRTKGGKGVQNPDNFADVI